MVAKIFSIIAIIAGLAAGAVAYLKVVPRIKSAEENWKKFEGQFKAEQSAHGKTKEELAATIQTLTTTSNQLVKTESDLKAKTQEAADLAKMADDLTNQVKSRDQQIASLKQEYAEWLDVKKELKITRVDIVRETFAKLPKAEEARDTYEAENKLLALRNKKLENELDKMVEEKGHVRMPFGLAGKITAVDPKYEFVVLNVGSRQGVKQNGELTIQRDGRFVGKVKITNVEVDHSVGSILREWRKGELAEGDNAVYVGQ